MKYFVSMLVAGTLGGTLLGCSSTDRIVGDRKGRAYAEGSGTIVAGGHCESSALVNALRGLGWVVSERDIVGGGGAPSFMFAAEGFPFLGGRSILMRETFLSAAGVPYRVVVPLEGGGGKDASWGPVLDLLETGTPVPLRVDMRFLPYRYGGKIGPKYMSFGWHWITLFGVDYDRRVAFVSDTEFGSLQEIRLVDLDRARRSDLKQWPPRGEYVELSRPQAGAETPDRSVLLAAGLAAVLDNYEGKADWSAVAGSPPPGALPLPSGLAGLEAFPEALRNFDRYAKPWIVGPALSFLAGCIERNGTGGAAFRVLFRDFIAAGKGDIAGLPGADATALLPALDASISAWRGLSAEFDATGASITAKSSAADRAAAYARCANAAEKVAQAERTLRAALVEQLQGRR